MSKEQKVPDLSGLSLDDTESEDEDEQKEKQQQLKKEKEKERKKKEEEQEKEKQRKKKKEEQEKEKQRKKKEEEDTFRKEDASFDSKCTQAVDEKILSEDIMTYFRHSGIYGDLTPGCWPSTVTILYYKLRIVCDDVADTYSSIRRIQNTTKSHAEDLLLQKLELVLKRNCKVKLVDIALELSYSPCNDCAKKVVSFLTKQKATVKLSIKIANFYKLYDKDNVAGLCLLIKNGVNLSVFSGETDWIKFYHDFTGKDPEKDDVSENRKKREAVDETILERLKMIVSFSKETELLQPQFQQLFDRLFPFRFEQTDISSLKTETKSLRKLLEKK